MRVAETIKSKLEAAFSPASLVIEDESHRHAGHAGSRAEGETHFRVAIVSPVFAGLGRVERQRRVHAVVAEELIVAVQQFGLPHGRKQLPLFNTVELLVGTYLAASRGNSPPRK